MPPDSFVREASPERTERRPARLCYGGFAFRLCMVLTWAATRGMPQKRLPAHRQCRLSLSPPRPLASHLQFPCMFVLLSLPASSVLSGVGLVPALPGLRYVANPTPSKCLAPQVPAMHSSTTQLQAVEGYRLR